MINDNSIDFEYSFEIDGETETFTCSVDKQTQLNNYANAENPPDWAELDCEKCANCTLNSKDNPYCPAALSLGEVLKVFSKYPSYTKMTATVEVESRVYISKDADLQQGLSSLVGLLLATSGCPHFAPFKAMALFHLPFSTPEETFYRVYTAALAKSHFSDEMDTFSLNVINEVYEKISVVNSGIAKRIRQAVVEGDSSLNSIVILDIFAQIFIIDNEETMEQIKSYFVT